MARELSLLERLARLDGEARERVLREMPPARRSAVARCWGWTARPSQLPPAGDWSVWLILAGRGFGKTRTGAEWVTRTAAAHPGARFALVGPTAHDALAADFSDTLELAAEYTAQWLGRPEGSGGSIKVSTDFGMVSNADKIMATVLRLRELGDLSAEDGMLELQRAGVLSDALDVEAALERAATDMARSLRAAGNAGTMPEPGPGA